MACDECEKARKIDGDTPDCERSKGCLIPPLGERGVRVMAMRERLMRLKGLVDPATILTAYGATRDDLDILAMVENIMETARSRSEKGANHG